MRYSYMLRSRIDDVDPYFHDGSFDSIKTMINDISELGPDVFSSIRVEVILNAMH